MAAHLGQEIQKTTIRFIGTGILLLFVAIALSVVWNRSIKDELATQASIFVRKGIISKEMRGVVEYLNGVQFSAFETVSLYRANGEHVVTLPPIMDRKEREENFWRAIFYGTLHTRIYLDTDRRDPVANAVFTYFRFELAPYAVIIWLLAAVWLTAVLRQAKRRVESEFANQLKVRDAEATEEIAKKVRHNIRSPLAVLKALFVDQCADKDVFFQQGRNAVFRLEEIVSEMRADAQGITAKKSTRPAIYEISRTPNEIVAEKKLIAKDVEISFENKCGDASIYSNISAPDLRAMLSNLIDNSLQAITGSGRVAVVLDADPYAISIEIEDTGSGIPEEIINRVFEKGFTFGTHRGSGLGLYYAKKLIESQQGNIEVTSQLGHGTKIILTFPRVSTPTWHIDRLDLSHSREVAICDDQPGIIQSWQNRFNELKKAPVTRFYATCEEMMVELDMAIPRTYLIDYDLGKGKMTGLDFIRSLTERGRAILVTGHFDEPSIQEECMRIGCKLLSKDDIFQIRIS